MSTFIIVILCSLVLYLLILVAVQKKTISILTSELSKYTIGEEGKIDEKIDSLLEKFDE